MCDVPVFYATTEGHTQRIAERMAERIRSHGLDSRAIAIVSDEAARIDWRRVRGAALGASLHMQKHQGEAEAFTRLYHAELSAVPSLFFSVSLAAASTSPAEVDEAKRLANRLPVNVGWHPMRVAAVAGCLAYTRYNWLVRMFMRRVARQEGASTDMRCDHDYTNWPQVEQLADELAAAIHRHAIFPAAGESSLTAAS